MNGNGQKDELLKWCPILKEWCSKDVLERCAFGTEMHMPSPMGVQRMKICGVHALMTMISQINAKTQPPQQKIQLPHLYRG